MNAIALPRWLYGSVAAFIGALVLAPSTACAQEIRVAGSKAETVVQGTVSEYGRRAEAVLQELGVQITERDVDGNDVDLEGRVGDRRVEVEIDDEGGNRVEIEVKARRNGQPDPEYARMVLERILGR